MADVAHGRRGSAACQRVCAVAATLDKVVTGAYTRAALGAAYSAQRRADMPHVFRWILVATLILALAWTLQPASAADVKLTLWRLKTYIPPADKILDTTIQECGKKIGADVSIQ